MQNGQTKVQQNAGGFNGSGFTQKSHINYYVRSIHQDLLLGLFESATNTNTRRDFVDCFDCRTVKIYVDALQSSPRCVVVEGAFSCVECARV